MRYPVLILLLAVVCYGCKKKEETPYVPPSGTPKYPGDIRFVNKSAYKFTVYVNGVYNMRVLERETKLYRPMPSEIMCRIVQDPDTSMVVFDSTYMVIVTPNMDKEISFP